jgi:hypothetical protein
MSECGRRTRNSFFRIFNNNNYYYYYYYYYYYLFYFNFFKKKFGPPPNPTQPYSPTFPSPFPPLLSQKTPTQTPPSPSKYKQIKLGMNEVMRRAKMVPTYYHADDEK